MLTFWICLLYTSSVYDGDFANDPGIPTDMDTIKQDFVKWVYKSDNSKGLTDAVSYTHLDVYKRQGNEFLLMVQNHMSQEMGITDEYSISYTVVGEAGEDNPGAVKVLATCLLYTSRCV